MLSRMHGLRMMFLDQEVFTIVTMLQHIIDLESRKRPLKFQYKKQCVFQFSTSESAGAPAYPLGRSLEVLRAAPLPRSPIPSTDGHGLV